MRRLVSTFWSVFREFLCLKYCTCFVLFRLVRIGVLFFSDILNSFLSSQLFIICGLRSSLIHYYFQDGNLYVSASHWKSWSKIFELVYTLVFFVAAATDVVRRSWGLDSYSRIDSAVLTVPHRGGFLERWPRIPLKRHSPRAPVFLNYI